MSSAVPVVPVSVVMPLYNGAATVIRALESIACQTARPREVIVVDDGSTDGGGSLAASFGAFEVTVISQANAGVSAARNTGIMKASQPVVAFLDADDFWLPGHVASLYGLVARFPQCRLWATAYSLETHESRSDVRPVGIQSDFTGLLPGYFRLACCSAPPVWTSAAAVPRRALLDLGGFDTRVTSGEDLLMWARLAADAPVAYDAAVSAVYVGSPGNVLGNAASRPCDRYDRVGECLEALADRSHDPWARRYAAVWHRMRTANAVASGQHGLALRSAFRALRCRPLFPAVWAWGLLSLLPHRAALRALGMIAALRRR